MYFIIEVFKLDFVSYIVLKKTKCPETLWQEPFWVGLANRQQNRYYF